MYRVRENQKRRRVNVFPRIPMAIQKKRNARIIRVLRSIIHHRRRHLHSHHTGYRYGTATAVAVARTILFYYCHQTVFDTLIDEFYNRYVCSETNATADDVMIYDLIFIYIYTYILYTYN